MKKKILIISIIVLFLVLLIPIPMRLKDGGSVEYKSIIYKVTKVKRLVFDGKYNKGLIIEIFGIQVFNNVVTNVSIKKVSDGSIIMKIKEGTLTKTSVTVIITDFSKKGYLYGEEFKIERKINSVWSNLDPINENYGFDDIGYTLNKEKKLELKQDWSYIYGELPEGEYRLVKYVFNNNEGTIPKEDDKLYFFVEFSIDG